MSVLSAIIITLIYHAYSLESGKLAWLETPYGDGKHAIEVTDGSFFISALASRSDGLLSCSLTEDKEKAIALLTKTNPMIIEIGEKGKMDMWKRCISKEMSGTHFEKRNGIDGTGVPFTPEKTGDPAGHKLDLAIFPGTKWCGLDNVASSYNDLGKYKNTDMCCRDHDHCPYFLDHFAEKYHLRNPYPWTISHCDCDTGLFNCLKKLNTTTSNEVGEMFFGLLNVKCIKFEQGQYCAKEHWSKLWCEQTTSGEKAVLHSFPYKWADDVVG
ncbi:group 3 secretory phospholipase A2-like [Mytilus trossulus]|uniref:group 3 secretory phospholipase A2-like n=1 Tax=Mytilus trossulus TaxID=6551 RepID=UPI003006BCF2